jgi:hypothetical protein
MDEPRPSTGASALVTVNIMDQLDNFEFAVLQPTSNANTTSTQLLSDELIIREVCVTVNDCFAETWQC